MQVFLAGSSYHPASIKTQPIVYPANPPAVGTSVLGSPIQTDEIQEGPSATGIHAILSPGVFHPVSSLSGIQESATPSFTLNPIIGTAEGSSIPLSVQNVTAPNLSAVPQLAPAPVAPATDYSMYALIGAAVLFLYFHFKGD